MKLNTIRASKSERISVIVFCSSHYLKNDCADRHFLDLGHSLGWRAGIAETEVRSWTPPTVASGYSPSFSSHPMEQIWGAVMFESADWDVRVGYDIRLYVLPALTTETRWQDAAAASHALVCRRDS